MMLHLQRWLEAAIRVVAYLAMTLFLALTFVTLYEVVSRYGFNAPTFWAFDMIYMLHGALFTLGAAYTLQKNAHVRIDVLAARFPERVQHAVNAVAYILLFLPALGIMAEAAVLRSYSAYVTDERELVSAWAPKVWPFYAVLAFALVCLWLQSLLEAIRHVRGLLRGTLTAHRRRRGQPPDTPQPPV